jgi:hypothetical protein
MLDLFINIKHVTDVTSRDEGMFRSFFEKMPIAYANSWLYTIRASHADDGSMGYKFSDGHSLWCIAYRNKTIYITNPMGDGIIAPLKDLCSTLRKRTSSRIILRKLNSQVYTQLQSIPVFTHIEDHSSILEDDAYPEQCINLTSIFSTDLEHSRLKNVRRKTHHFRSLQVSFSPLFLDTNHADISLYSSVFCGDMNKQNTCAQLIRTAGNSNTDILKYISCIYCNEAQIIHGIYVSELLSEHDAGLYCSVTSQAYEGITEWMDYDFFDKLHNKKIDTLYLGGSETIGIHTYTQKFFPQPCTPEYYSLEYLGDSL